MIVWGYTTQYIGDYTTPIEESRTKPTRIILMNQPV